MSLITKNAWLTQCFRNYSCCVFYLGDDEASLGFPEQKSLLITSKIHCCHYTREFSATYSHLGTEANLFVVYAQFEGANYNLMDNVTEKLNIH